MILWDNVLAKFYRETVLDCESWKIQLELNVVYFNAMYSKNLAPEVIRQWFVPFSFREICSEFFQWEYLPQMRITHYLALIMRSYIL